MTLPSYDTLLYTNPADRVVRIVLNRPDRANAQNMQLLYELDAALTHAARDDGVHVIVLAAAGKHFSSGHDLSGADDWSPAEAGSSTWGGFDAPGIEANWGREEDAYFGLCWRWRNIPKPTIAEVQGKVIAGGLMLVWPFDLVVASDDATFQDPVVAFGVNGVEYFGHPWEFGVRKAKEMLFTGRAITAQVARELGMVNRVVPRAGLADATMELAMDIAAQPMMGLKTAKESVNQAQNHQGLHASLRSAMGMQQLGHANNLAVHGSLVDPAGVGLVRALAKKPPLSE